MMIQSLFILELTVRAAGRRAACTAVALAEAQQALTPRVAAPFGAQGEVIIEKHWGSAIDRSVRTRAPLFSRRDAARLRCTAAFHAL